MNGSEVMQLKLVGHMTVLITWKLHTFIEFFFFLMVTKLLLI